MKKTVVFSTIMTSLIAGHFALANSITAHGLQSYTGNHFPKKIAQQMAPDFVIAIGNHLNENIDVSVNAGNGSIYPVYAANSTNFVYSYDPIGSAYVVVNDDQYNQLIYRGMMYNGQCLDVKGAFGYYEYKITDNCIPLE